MKKRYLAALTAILAVAGITASIAGGMWQTLPIIAAQAYCAVLSTGVTGTGAPFNPTPTGATICQVQIPAGPPALTGNEVLPADAYPASSPYLTVPQGVAPSTVGIPVILTDSGAFTYSVPNATLANFSMTNPTNWLIMDGTAALTAINITLPGTLAQAALNGQQVHIVSAQNVVALVVKGALGTTIDNSPTQLIVGATTSAASLTFVYDAPISTWFRLQ